MSHQTEYGEYGHKDHGHFIVPAITLRVILAALLFFTVLTVCATWAEEWVALTFHVAIPTWMNVVIALSIATVKTVLVVMFFMQLKYDNPMNSLILVFTVMTVASFLGFTALDLGKRDTIDRFKSRYIVPGGPGGNGLPNNGIPITQKAREDAIANHDYHPEHAHHPHEEGQEITYAGYLPELPKVGSSSSKSRPVTGITLSDVPGYKPPVEHGHGEPAAAEGHPGATPAPEPAEPAAGHGEAPSTHPTPPPPLTPAPKPAEPPKSGH